MEIGGLYLRSYLWIIKMKKAFGNSPKEDLMVVMESEEKEKKGKKYKCRMKTAPKVYLVHWHSRLL